MIIVRVPLRISLGGGGTDLFHWYKNHNSFLVTATINKFIYLTISRRDLSKDFWLSYSKIENINKKKKIKHSIIKEILNKYFINNGLEVHTISEVPSNSGLGSSGALSVGLIQALMKQNKKDISINELAEKAVNIEMKLNKKAAGKQDQYASAYGGFIKLSINKNGKTKVEKLKISKSRTKEFEQNIYLIYIQNRRFTYQILKKQSKLINNKFSKITIMKKIQKLGFKSCELLENGKIDDYGYLLDEHWNLKKKIGTFMSNPNVNILYENLKKNGVTGGKIIGAGGGGFLMTFVPKKNRSKFNKYIKKKNLDILDWNFHPKGSEIIFSDD